MLDATIGDTVTLSDTHLNDAYVRGQDTAMTEFDHGAAAGREAPLSGEWADELTPATLHAAVLGHFADDTDEGRDHVTQLADEFERGYDDTWTTTIPAIRGDDDE